MRCRLVHYEYAVLVSFPGFFSRLYLRYMQGRKVVFSRFQQGRWGGDDDFLINHVAYDAVSGSVSGMSEGP